MASRRVKRGSGGAGGPVEPRSTSTGAVATTMSRVLRSPAVPGSARAGCRRCARPSRRAACGRWSGAGEGSAAIGASWKPTIESSPGTRTRARWPRRARRWRPRGSRRRPRSGVGASAEQPFHRLLAALFLVRRLGDLAAPHAQARRAHRRAEPGEPPARRVGVARAGDVRDAPVPEPRRGARPPARRRGRRRR